MKSLIFLSVLAVAGCAYADITAKQAYAISSQKISMAQQDKIDKSFAEVYLAIRQAIYVGSLKTVAYIVRGTDHGMIAHFHKNGFNIKLKETDLKFEDVSEHKGEFVTEVHISWENQKP